MIGLMSRTTSPSSVVSSRSTPCVAGWCGPMLSVSSSSCSGCAMWESSCDSSISRYGRCGALRVVSTSLTPTTPGSSRSLYVNRIGSPPIGKSRRCGWPS